MLQRINFSMKDFSTLLWNLILQRKSEKKKKRFQSRSQEKKTWKLSFY